MELRSVPDRIGRFLVRGILGSGAHSTVFHAVDPELDREVAVKVLAEDWSMGDQVDLFVKEGRIASRLEHPSIVPIHELGRTDDGGVFLVMRRVRGQALTDVLRARVDIAASRPRLIAAFASVCQAVGYAHDRGVVHRDLKPANVMLGDYGEVYVVDWGLAGRSGRSPLAGLSDPQSTQDGTLIGTLGYMSPEAVWGANHEVGPASDVYGLGAILYEILSGRRALEGPDLLQANLEGRVVPLEMVAADLDDVLAGIVARALAVEASHRYPDAHALAVAVQAWQDGVSRRARADLRVLEGRASLTSWQGRTARAAEDEAAIRAMEAEYPPWLPYEAPAKRAVREAREARDADQIALANLYSEVESAAQAAMVLDPDHPGARALLADAAAARLGEAESAGRRADVAYFRSRLAAWDDGTRMARLTASGAVSLSTDPAGARVIARRYDQRSVVWSLGEPVDLGQTPIRRAPLAPGSWVLEVIHPDRPPVKYPVLIARGEDWDEHGERVLRLPTAHDLGEEWVFLPGGPFFTGGDPEVNLPRPLDRSRLGDLFVARFAVTAEQYATFLEDLWRSDEDLAWSRVPRIQAEAHGQLAPLWPPRPTEGWAFPLRDRDGDEWLSTWPVCAITWDDALAYCAWRAERDGRSIRLISELAYEKAARGVDARSYPWGDGWDPALSKNIQSRQGTPRPEPIGAFPTDASVYGVRDLAGCARTWCSDPTFDGDPNLRAMRGGSWASNHKLCRAANRYGMEPKVLQQWLGLRITISMEAENG